VHKREETANNKMLGEPYERHTRCGGALTAFKIKFVNFSAVRAQEFTRGDD
jgi:hypothetical protein